MKGTRTRFPGPSEVETPPRATGWQSMYPYYYLFSDDRKEYEERQFWYQDALHHPEPLYPFDTITCESWWVGLGQNNTRIFLVPPALGIDQRVLNGYLYITPIAVEDPEEVARRLDQFLKRAGYYYENWDTLYAQWKTKANETIRALEAVEIPELPHVEPEAVVTEARGLSSGYQILESFHQVVDNMYRMWQFHFEFLNLGYAAYLTFYQFCKKAFPDIPDQSIALMVAGIDVLLYRPDAELRRLAALAVDLGVADLLEASLPDGAIALLQESEAGRRWLADFEGVKHPWFYFSKGTGFYHHHRSWIDDLAAPLSGIREYARKLQKGERVERPLADLQKRRDEIADGYAALLPEGDDRKAFRDLLGLARTVFPYVEEHNFFVEHWHHTVFWNKVREFGAVMARAGFFDEADDIFYLHRFEVKSALYDMVTAWACGGVARGVRHWPPEVARRKQILQELQQWAPPPVLGQPPETIEEPFTVMLWGITSERVKGWLATDEDPEQAGQVTGFAGSPGVVEGYARRITSLDQIDEVLPGEILICPITTPSWAPVFGKIQAVVTDIGGIMSHAAIVCREYGLPAVVGTGFGTKRIATGQRVRVDGGTGVVTLIDA